LKKKIFETKKSVFGNLETRLVLVKTLKNNTYVV